MPSTDAVLEMRRASHQMLETVTEVGFDWGRTVDLRAALASGAASKENYASLRCVTMDTILAHLGLLPDGLPPPEVRMAVNRAILQTFGKAAVTGLQANTEMPREVFAISKLSPSADAKDFVLCIDLTADVNVAHSHLLLEDTFVRPLPPDFPARRRGVGSLLWEAIKHTWLKWVT